MTSPERADTWLERALLFNFVIHGLALVGMALVLMPMLPGGSDLPEAVRIAAIAEHPWRFRAGWLPWQRCAVADVWLALAMVRVGWLPRGAWAVLVLTLAAVGVLGSSSMAQAQATGQISGTVTGEGGRPISGASVSVAGTTRGDQTDAAGRFTISAVPGIMKLARMIHQSSIRPGKRSWLMA